MFFENPTDLILGCESSVPRRLQAAIYPYELFRCRVVHFDSQPGINFKRDLRKFGLRLLRPGRDAFKQGFQALVHDNTIAQKRLRYSLSSHFLAAAGGWADGEALALLSTPFGTRDATILKSSSEFIGLDT